MDRGRVADFYRGKGYIVHASIVVTGQSGNQQRVPLLCEGPLGNLAVFFGDAGGIDGHEIGAAKRVARDLGATAVVFAGHFTAEQRQTAAELGVVLLDESALAPSVDDKVPSVWPGTTARDALDRDLAAHPWPASGRPGGLDLPGGRDSATYEVDDLLARFDRAKPSADAAVPAAGAIPVPSRPAAPPASPVQVPAPTAHTTPSTPATPTPSTASEPAGLWKHARPGAAPSSPASVAVPAAPVAIGGRDPSKFAWLKLPPTPEPAAQAEYEGRVAARPAHTNGTQAAQATSEAAVEEDPVLRAVRLQRRRKRVRQAAWMLGVGVFVYLFLLWWF